MHSGVRVISRHYVHTRGGDRLTMEARGPGSTAITANNRPANVSKFDSSRSCVIHFYGHGFDRINRSLDILSTFYRNLVNLSHLSNDYLKAWRRKIVPFLSFIDGEKYKLKNKKRCQSLYLQFFMNEIYKGCQNRI